MDRNFSTILVESVPPVKVKPPENYYSRNFNFITLFSYVGMMAVIFLAFGYIRVKRQDKKKSRGLDKIEEMMESFGLQDIQKQQLMTITKSFNAKLKTQEAEAGP